MTRYSSVSINDFEQVIAKRNTTNETQTPEESTII